VGVCEGGGARPPPRERVSRAAAEGRRTDCVCEAESELESVGEAAGGQCARMRERTHCGKGLLRLRLVPEATRVRTMVGPPPPPPSLGGFYNSRGSGGAVRTYASADALLKAATTTATDS